MRQIFLSVLAVLCALPTLAQPPAAPGKLTFDDLFSDERTGRRPTQTAWQPSGDALTYLWDAGDGEALWRLSAATGETTKLLAVAGMPASEPDAEPSIDAYHGSPAGDALLIESGGDLWLFRPGGEVERLTGTEAAEEAPAFSPDGTKIAYVRDANLYLLDLSAPAGERAERALTTDGEPDVTLNGTTDWVYWEEIWGRDATGFWWSPDSTRIAYYRFDDTPVAEYTLLPDYTPVYPEPRLQRYPKAGSDNPKVRVGVLDLAGGATTWLDAADPDEESYLARVHWVEREAGPAEVAIERLNREQTELDLLLCGAESGDCHEVLRESHPTWVNLGNDTTFLPGGRFLWASERSGWRHLYLYALPAFAGGEAELVRQLTSGPGAVTSVDHADAERVIATAYGTGPLGAARRRLLEVPLEGGGVRELAAGSEPGAGWHGAEASPNGRYLLHRWSSADDPGWTRIEETGGAVTAELPSEPPAYDPASLPKWGFLEVAGPDGSRLPAMILEPAGGAAHAKHPVIMYHYGGPGSQVVTDSWGGRGLWHKMTAQRGYGVLVVDNLASVFFGKAGEDRVHRRFGEVNLAAQKAAVAYLATLPWADASRVGLWGWSGGGANTLYCLLNSPGTWRAAVAGAPVTDWRYYDTIWTERYLDRPESNPDGYRDSSAVTYAENLKDRLLIVHGTADDNVHPQNTMALVRQWIDKDIPFEIAIYPGEKHGFKDAASRHFYERMTEFFERTLK
jgi:dipeptidyl-peptidase-4